MPIESVMPPNHLILCHFLLLLPSIFPNIRGFSSESVLCITWPKYWTQDLFLLRLTGLISLQSKGLSKVFSNTTVQKQILWCSDFFMVQLSDPYMTTGKTIALTRPTFVSKVTSRLFSMLLGWFWLFSYGGYSIYSKRLFPTVVDIIVISVKFTHSYSV